MNFKDLPQIIKVNAGDWYEAMNCFQPNMRIIESTNAQFSQVIQMDSNYVTVATSKFIPIPIFLVSFFINRGIPCSALAMCQVFDTSVFNIASTDLQNSLRHVKIFLMVGTGAERNPQVPTDPLMS